MEKRVERYGKAVLDDLVRDLTMKLACECRRRLQECDPRSDEFKHAVEVYASIYDYV